MSYGSPSMPLDSTMTLTMSTGTLVSKGKPPVVQHDLVCLPAFAAKVEGRTSVAQEFHVPGTQCRQTERSVRPRVFLVADAHERFLEQRDDNGKNFLPGQSRQCAIVFQPATQSRQSLTEFDHARKLAVVTRLTPARVVSILLASPRVAAGRLQMPSRLRANPDVGVSRRNRQHPDAIEHAFRMDRSPVRSDIAKAPAASLPRDAGLRVVHIEKTTGTRVTARLRDRLRLIIHHD